MKNHTLSAATVAHALETAARRSAPTVAVLITLALACYGAGYRFGRAVHAANDALARYWPTRPTTPTTPTTPTRPTTARPTTTTAPTPADALTDRVRALRADGLSPRAIAAACGISRATVRRRLAMV